MSHRQEFFKDAFNEKLINYDVPNEVEAAIRGCE